MSQLIILFGDDCYKVSSYSKSFSCCVVGEVDVESAVESFGGAVLEDESSGTNNAYAAKRICSGPSNSEASLWSITCGGNAKTTCALVAGAVPCDGGEDDIGHEGLVSLRIRFAVFTGSWYGGQPASVSDDTQRRRIDRR